MADFSIGRFFTELGARIDESTIRNAERRFEGLRKRIAGVGKAFDVVKLNQGLELIGRVARGVSRAVASLTTEVAALGDQAAKDAKRLGLTAEAVQELNFAAELSGANFEVVKTGLQAFARGLEDAITKGVGPTKEAFDELGISMEDPRIQSQDLEKILPVLADRLSELPNGAEKTALAMRLFSRSGAQLIPFLNEGSRGIAAMRAEARELGLVTNEGAAASEQFVDTQLRFNTVLAGLRKRIGVELLPVLTRYLERGQEWLQQNGDLIATRIEEWVGRLIDKVEELAPVVLRAVESLGSLLDMLTSPTGLVVAFTTLGGLIGGLPGLLAGMAAAAGVTLGNLAADLAGVNDQLERARENERRAGRLGAGASAAEKLSDRVRQGTLGELSRAEFDRLTEAVIRATPSFDLTAIDRAFEEQRDTAQANAALERFEAGLRRSAQRSKRGRRKGGGRRGDVLEVTEFAPEDEAEIVAFADQAARAAADAAKRRGALPDEVEALRNRARRDADRQAREQFESGRGIPRFEEGGASALDRLVAQAAGVNPAVLARGPLAAQAQRPVVTVTNVDARLTLTQNISQAEGEDGRGFAERVFGLFEERWERIVEDAAQDFRPTEAT